MYRPIAAKLYSFDRVHPGHATPAGVLGCMQCMRIFWRWQERIKRHEREQGSSHGRVAERGLRTVSDVSALSADDGQADPDFGVAVFPLRVGTGEAAQR